MKSQTMKFIFAIGSLLLPTMFASANYSNGIGEVAQLHDALSRRASNTEIRQPAQVRNLMAQSDCGEIYNSNNSGYSCTTCSHHRAVMNQCAPAARFFKTGIIDDDGRRLLTEEEYKMAGASVGSLECQDPVTKQWYVSTGFVVASDLVHISAHGLYEKVNLADGGHIFRRNFDPKVMCDFSLRDLKGHVMTFDFEVVKECEGRTAQQNFKNCEWAVAKLKSKVPPHIKPLKLLPPQEAPMVGLSVFAIGHHHGVNINGKDVPTEEKLIDYGVIKEKPADSPLYDYPQLFPYTADTNTISSGQPVMAKINGEIFVIGTNVGDKSAHPDRKGKWHDVYHFNFGEYNRWDVFDALKELASPEEKSLFETPKRKNSLTSSTSI